MSALTASAPKTRPLGPPPDPGWIVSPSFDLLFLANLGWLAALLPGFVSTEGTVHVEFWQVYFLTTPHRWITLLLVAADPDRREGRTGWFIVIALVALAVVWGVKLYTGAFVCLLLVDYVWNGWHFASQHYGVLRIYGRKVGGGLPALERYGLRLFIFYVIARTAGWSTGWLEASALGASWLRTIDLLMLVVPAGLLMTELIYHPRRRLPKLIYLASVSGLYAALLLALRAWDTALILALTVASAMFHAVEYLAIITHYAWRRQTNGSDGLFRAMAGRWLGILAVYLVAFGLLAAVVQRQASEWWLGLNLWAALLHYAYDGMIWKLRRPATAQALGVEPSTAASAEGARLASGAFVRGCHSQPALPVTTP